MEKTRKERVSKLMDSIEIGEERIRQIIEEETHALYLVMKEVLKEIEEIYGVKPGDVITNIESENEFIFKGIVYKTFGLYLIVSPIKKDGTPSKNERFERLGYFGFTDGICEPVASKVIYGTFHAKPMVLNKID